MDEVSDSISLCNDVHGLKHVINKCMRLVIGPIGENFVVAANPSLDLGKSFFNGIEIR